MSSLRRITPPLAVAALLLAALIGCGRLPSSPTVPTGSGLEAPRLLAPHDAGLLDPVRALLVRVLKLVGSVGGSLTNARWRVDIPAGAVQGSAVVTMVVTSSTSGSCQLEISPPEKNGFATPVTLTVDCRNVSAAELATWGILYFDPRTGKWVPVEGSRVDPARKTVSAPLVHFSRYGVGPLQTKAGWSPVTRNLPGRGH